MHSIEKAPYGLQCVFAGNIENAEMDVWYQNVKQDIVSLPLEFGVFMDAQNLEGFSMGALIILERGQRLFRAYGMVRSVVIIRSAEQKNIFQLLASKSGISRWEQYVNASETPDWENAGVLWVIHRDGSYLN